MATITIYNRKHPQFKNRNYYARFLSGWHSHFWLIHFNRRIVTATDHETETILNRILYAYKVILRSKTKNKMNTTQNNANENKATAHNTLHGCSCSLLSIETHRREKRREERKRRKMKEKNHTNSLIERIC